jgi:hypothetical protein
MAAAKHKATGAAERKGRTRTATKEKRRSTAKAESRTDSFATRYPHIAQWVGDGWIEMGRDDYNRSFVRALDIGGLVWEGSTQYATLDEALQALETGIAEWLRENG